MPSSKDLPCSMCPGCSNYSFVKGSSQPHRCKSATTFSSKIKNGTCSYFKN